MSAPVAVITGASQGIGAGLVDGYRRAGYPVVGVALSLRASDEDNEYVAIAGDIAKAETARRAVDQALDRFGRIDTLINNAGIYIGKPFTQYTLEDYAAITAVNLTGFFHITQLAIEYASRGVRVNTVSLGVIKTPAHEPRVLRGVGKPPPAGARRRSQRRRQRNPLPRASSVRHRRDAARRRRPNSGALAPPLRTPD